MKGIKDNTPDFNDLLFESRNKEYGAYQLRKKYNSAVTGGIFVSVFIGCALVLIPFFLRPRNEQVVSGGGHYVQMRMENLEPPKEEVYVPPALPPKESTPIQNIVKYVPPVVVDSVKPLEPTPVTTDEALLHSGEAQEETAGTGIGDDVLDGGDGSDAGEPFYLVEVMPTFRGGDINKFREWVQRRTNYPQAAIDAKIRGTVFLTFIVEKDGSVSNVTVIKGVHPLIDNEAVKAISESPKWSPGRQRGQPVRVRFQIPLSFVF